MMNSAGYKVSDTIRKGIIDVSQYEDDPLEYMIGNLAALGEEKEMFNYMLFFVNVNKEDQDR